jgi:hypothetical protein
MQPERNDPFMMEQQTTQGCATRCGAAHPGDQALQRANLCCQTGSNNGWNGDFLIDEIKRRL